MTEHHLLGAAVLTWFRDQSEIWHAWCELCSSAGLYNQDGQSLDHARVCNNDGAGYYTSPPALLLERF
jgi:hypothetical protein